jgi:4-hydroxy-2-oxoheptanedioate aldolase
MQDLRETWKRGEPAWGGWCTIPSPWAAEVMARAGFDYVTVDMQHGLIGYSDMVGMVQAIHAAGTTAIVRVPWNQPDHIMRALDAGAQGVIVPMVNSPEEALSAVGACRYAPTGYRSWGPVRSRFMLEKYTVEAANSGVICCVMVETATGVGRVDEILSTPGIDVVYIGPNDLAVSVGAPTSYAPEGGEHRRLIDATVEAARRHGLVAGIQCAGVEQGRLWAGQGVRMVTVVTDTNALLDTAREVLAGVRKARAAAS